MIGEALRAAAATMYLWRDVAVAALALIVIAALWLYVTIQGEP